MYNLSYEVDKILNIFECRLKGLMPCGSRVICKPPPTDTDEDWLVLIDEKEMQGVAERLANRGFVLGGSIVLDENTLQNPSGFWSYTCRDLNLIITCDETFYERFKLATEVAEKLNLQPKQARIDLFQVILYHDTRYLKKDELPF